MPSRRQLSALVLSVFFLIPGAPALAAGGVQEQLAGGSQIWILFDDGASSSLTATNSGSGSTFSNSTGLSDQTFPGSCTQPSSTSLNCSYGDQIFVLAGGGGDTIDLTGVDASSTLIDAGAGSDAVTGSPSNDDIRAEDGEFDSVACGGGTDIAYVDGGDTVANCEDVRRPAPNIQMTFPEVTEGSALQFQVQLNYPAPTAFTMDYAVEHVTTSNDDLSPSGAPSGTISFAAGDTTQTVTVPTTDDTAQESTETLKLKLSNMTPPGSASPASLESTGTITDDDTPPSASVGDASAVEGGSASFDVSLSQASGSTVTVAYATSDGTAVAPADYSAKSGTVSFAPGETQKTVAVDTAQDGLDEEDETLSVALSSPTSATISDGTGAGTITDDDETVGPPPLGRLQPSVLITATPRRDRRAPFRFVVAGQLLLPGAADPEACRAGGTVTLEVQQSRGRRNFARQAELDATCRFRFRLSLGQRPGRGRLQAVVAFAGNPALLPARSERRSVRVG